MGKILNRKFGICLLLPREKREESEKKIWKQFSQTMQKSCTGNILCLFYYILPPPIRVLALSLRLSFKDVINTRWLDEAHTGRRERKGSGKINVKFFGMLNIKLKQRIKINKKENFYRLIAIWDVVFFPKRRQWKTWNHSILKGGREKLG